MLGWEVVECQQFIPILDQAFGRLRIFRLEGFDEQIERSMGILAGLGLPDVVKHLLRAPRLKCESLDSQAA